MFAINGNARGKSSSWKSIRNICAQRIREQERSDAMVSDGDLSKGLSERKDENDRADKCSVRSPLTWNSSKKQSTSCIDAGCYYQRTALK